MRFSNTATLDLHGESQDIARILINEFIQDAYKLGLEEVIIVHGIGSGIIKKTVQTELRKNLKVEKFYIDFFNVGQTIVKIKKRN